ncbi:3-hydroxy-9,10-secoandrosta-1,3,5(10)-triene-9,17-dione monooxygenase reductase component [Streptomyces sp. SAI-135]|uniref:flavin reductase family protein n=2 Tax=unclassified Streptomyces TaxID=2593676 RepID=UPI00247696B9|nr:MULTISPECIES: flavin reductase family protein [unclassified Streptomyces]MDH6523336.1 3-hydroxy-9,10-secoandrosta-1,3,5(10)-triene-9,17-dione monooxygenase reductase component [Streptomyces sp. SAI-090]MDH6613051.1 3-hydroxy-9,10-secoandrosta-1,3,5(10)-triene-9,17-dione monooxygenase reductase component [Streptomyces sp. SAI-135]
MDAADVVITAHTAQITAFVVLVRRCSACLHQCVRCLYYVSMLTSRQFRSVLGNFPSGIAAITSLDAEGRAVGMAVSSFTSVSLDPPLVAFLPGKASATFPAIARRGTFCANVLAAGQEDVCRALAVSGGDKFANLSWQPGPHGNPVLEGVVAWIDCTIEAVHDAGDHHIVIGRVDDLAADATADPLLFFRSRYHQLAAA